MAAEYRHGERGAFGRLGETRGRHGGQSAREDPAGMGRQGRDRARIGRHRGRPARGFPGRELLLERIGIFRIPARRQASSPHGHRRLPRRPRYGLVLGGLITDNSILL